MPKVTITREALDAIKAKAPPDFHSDAERQDGDLYTIPLESDVLKALLGRQLPGESLSDTIIRVASTEGGTLMN